MNNTPVTRKALELAVAEVYASARIPRDKWQSISDLEPQLAEFEHRIRAEDYKTAAFLLNEIDREYLYRWGHLQRVADMRQKLVNNLAMPTDDNKASQTEVQDLILEAENLTRLGQTLHNLAHYEKSIIYYQQALTLWRSAALKRVKSREEGVVLGGLGKAHFALGQYDLAIKYYERALQVAQDENSLLGQVIQADNLGRAYHELGQSSTAMTMFEQALKMLEALDPHQEKKHLRTVIFHDIARTYLDIGSYSEANTYSTRGLELVREIKDKRSESIQLSTLARGVFEYGFYNDALELYMQALEIDRQINSRPGKLHNLQGLGHVYLARKDLVIALEKLTEAFNMAQEVGSPWHLQRTGVLLAEAYLYAGQLAEALEIITIARQYDVPTNNHRAMGLHGIILARSGEISEAVSTFVEALDNTETLLNEGNQYFAVKYTRGLALVGLCMLNTTMQSSTHIETCYTAYEQAYASCDKNGIVEQARNLLTELKPLDAIGILDKLYDILAIS